jgi:hypothetical protein
VVGLGTFSQLRRFPAIPQWKCPIDEVLKEWTRERVPLQWAMTQHNRGNALAVLGKGALEGRVTSSSSNAAKQ